MNDACFIQIILQRVCSLEIWDGLLKSGQQHVYTYPAENSEALKQINCLQCGLFFCAAFNLPLNMSWKFYCSHGKRRKRVA